MEEGTERVFEKRTFDELVNLKQRSPRIVKAFEMPNTGYVTQVKESIQMKSCNIEKTMKFRSVKDKILRNAK